MGRQRAWTGKGHRYLRRPEPDACGVPPRMRIRLAPASTASCMRSNPRCRADGTRRRSDLYRDWHGNGPFDGQQNKGLLVGVGTVSTNRLWNRHQEGKVAPRCFPESVSSKLLGKMLEALNRECEYPVASVAQFVTAAYTIGPSPSQWLRGCQPKLRRTRLIS